VPVDQNPARRSGLRCQVDVGPDDALMLPGRHLKPEEVEDLIGATTTAANVSSKLSQTTTPAITVADDTTRTLIVALWPLRP
jgi:hypothetical protein